MNASTIVAYSYQAEVLCPHCILGAMGGDAETVGGASVERVLDFIAPILGVTQRYDERTFDSGDFPKVVFADQAGDDHCDNCGEELL